MDFLLLLVNHLCHQIVRSTRSVGLSVCRDVWKWRISLMIFQPGKPVKWGDMKSEITTEFSQKQWCVWLKRILWEGDRRCSSYFIYTSLYLLKECFALKQIELFNCLQSSYNVTNPMKPEDQSIRVHPAATWLVLSLPPNNLSFNDILSKTTDPNTEFQRKNLNFYILHHQKRDRFVSGFVSKSSLILEGSWI